MSLHHSESCESCGRTYRVSDDETATCKCGRVLWSADDVADAIEAEERADRAYFLDVVSAVIGIPAGAIELHSEVLLDFQMDHDFYVNNTPDGMVNGETPLSLVTVPVQMIECETPGYTTFEQATL